MTSNTIKTALQNAALTLKPISEKPYYEAECLLISVLTITRAQLWVDMNLILTPLHQAQFEQLIQRRAKGEPMAYLLGNHVFWDFQVQVNSSVLIPREETELLVKQSLSHISQDMACKILDLGTGSGVIALAIAKERPMCHVLAVDKSVEALEVAQKNAENLKITNIDFLQSEWFDKIAAQRFDIIVSNPPYIAYEDPALEKSVREFEPQTAYFASDEGLADIKIIINNAKDFLKPSGWLMMEHGYQQGLSVRELLEQAGFVQVETWKDLYGKDRITGGCFL